MKVLNAVQYSLDMVSFLSATVACVVSDRTSLMDQFLEIMTILGKYLSPDQPLNPNSAFLDILISATNSTSRPQGAEAEGK